MNWVGGIKRRLLLKEEEQRRQEQFFASAHTATNRRKAVLSDTQKKRESEDQNDNSRVQSHLHDKATAAHEEGLWCGPKATSGSRQGVRITRRLRLASIHTPLSEMLIRMEYEGTKRKLREKQRHQEKSKNWLKEVGTATISQIYMNGNDKSSDFSQIYTKKVVSKASTSSFHETPKIVKKTTTRSHLLDGAPSVRRILSLSPTRFKGEKIWTPFSLGIHPRSRTPRNSGEEHKKSSKSPNVCNTREFSPKVFAPNSFEKNLVKRLLGTAEPGQVSFDEDKNNQDQYLTKYFHTQEPTGVLNQAENDSFYHPSVDGKLYPLINSRISERSFETAKNTPKLNKSVRDLYCIDRESQTNRNHSNSSPIHARRINNSNRFDGTNQPRPLNSTTNGRSDKKIENLSKRINNKDLDNCLGAVEEFDSPKTHPRLNQLKRNLHIVDSGLDSQRTTSPKTPFLETYLQVSTTTCSTNLTFIAEPHNASSGNVSDGYLPDYSATGSEISGQRSPHSSGDSSVATQNSTEELSESILTPIDNSVISATTHPTVTEFSSYGSLQVKSRGKFSDTSSSDDD